VKVIETGWHVNGRFVLSATQGKEIEQPAYAVLISGSRAESGSTTELGAKRWMEIFFDLGRLIIAPDGRFQSRDPIPSGMYRLLGKMGGVQLDQQVEVPDPELNPFINGGFDHNAFDSGMIELGDIHILPHDTARAKKE
jgi:hypothetical protein